MDKITSQHQIMTASDETERKSRLLRAVNGVAEKLLTVDEGEFEDSLREGMALVAHCLNIDRIYIWQNKMEHGKLLYVQQFEWLDNIEPKGRLVYHKDEFSYAESIPEWEEKFIGGECVNGPLSSLSRTERERLEPYGIKSILVVPVHLRGRLWGFVSFDDCQKERIFTEEEISILRSANLMLASALNRHEINIRMREADKQTKLMLKSIEHKDNLLHTVNEVAAILLRSEINEFETELIRCMGMMANSVGADRMYIWENFVIDGHLYCTQLYEWSESAEPQQGGEYTVDIPYNETASDWKVKLAKGQCINSPVRNLPLSERAHLSAQGILSILVVPVFLRDQFWGFIGFDDCHSERVFTADEESILRSGSLLIANALLRNEMTNEIQAAVEQAQAASKAKSAFLARMSHEIRTPMNVIAGMTEIILQEDVPNTIYEHLLSIKQASANMLSLINDVLDFSKIEAGNLDIMPVEYSLTSLIDNVLSVTRLKIRERPVLLTANIDCNIPNRLIGDETRIRQILLNVLDNAAKYTAEGFIALTVNGETAGNMVRLTAEVSDSGIGIKKENMDSLFDDFIRFDGERHRSVQGTGLGLPIVKSLCHAMEGNIFVRSEYGKGSVFTIKIPQKIKMHSEKFAVVYAPETKRVLLYETRSIYSDSIARSLDNLGVYYTLVKTREEFYTELRRGIYPFVFAAAQLLESAGQPFKELNLNTTVVLIAEFGETPDMQGRRTIATPVHAASIANILNDVERNILYEENERGNVHFIAPSANILVVDDLNTNLNVAKGLLLPYQMQVDVCESGAKAIEYAQRKLYDIIFMDHMMPEMDGIETTGHIRALETGNGYYKKVPVIALTANAVSGIKEMFLQNGMDDFLSKPIDITKLHALLEKWISKEKKVKSKNTRPEPKPLDMNSNRIQIEGVDVQAGIFMVGGTVEKYLEVLTIFYYDGIDKINKLRDCIEKNDIKLYTTYTHALKSAAANIGAMEVSELFKTLETAGTRDDFTFIRQNTGRSLARLETLLKNIRAIIADNPDDSKKEDNPELFRAALFKLKKALEERDAGEIDDIMRLLETAKRDCRTDDLFKQLSENVFLIDYTGASLAADKLLEALKEVN